MASGVTVLEVDPSHRPDYLSDLGISEGDHEGESCHAVVLQGRAPGSPSLVGVCTARKNHNKSGTSAVKLPAKVSSMTDAERVANAEKRDAHAARWAAMTEAINGKIPKGVSTPLIMQSLIDTASADLAKKALRLLDVELS